MTKFERLRAALAGEAVDRLPYSFWYHFLDIPLADRAGEKLATAELEFYRAYDPDFLKVMHDIPYDLPEGMGKAETLAEWRCVPVVEPNEGNLGRHLEAIRLILAEIGDEAPVIDTVFNPFAYAEKITGGRTLELLRENPEEFHIGLRRIAETLSLWAETLVRQGAAGIYLAVQGATADVMSEEAYEKDFLPYDRQILEQVEDIAFLNVLHLHGAGLHWKLWERLSFNVLSWSSNLTPPSIAEARKSYSGCIAAGVNEMEIGGYAPQQVKDEIREAIEATGGRGLIVAPGCAVPTDCPPANLHAFKEAVAGK